MSWWAWVLIGIGVGIGASSGLRDYGRYLDYRRRNPDSEWMDWR